MKPTTKPLSSDNRPNPIARFVWVLALALLALAACRPTSELTSTDETEIYAAVVRRIYDQDDTFGGQLNPPVVYLVQATDDGVGGPEAERSPSQAIPDEVQAGVRHALADLPAEIVWVEEAEQVERDTRGTVAGGGVIVTLGNLHPQKDGSVQVSGSIYIAMLAAGGQTYVVEQINDVWMVTGNTGTVWMS
jgi:hypothetical protein